MSGTGISWAVCKSASHSRQTTIPAPQHSVFYRPDALPATQPTASKHWRPNRQCVCIIRLSEALRLSTFYLIVLVSSTRKLKQVLVTDEIRESTNFWYHLNVQGSLTKRVCISYNGHFNSCAIFAQYFNDHHIYTMISKQVWKHHENLQFKITKKYFLP